MSIPEFIKDVVGAGVEVTLLPDGFRVHGFYKSVKVDIKREETGDSCEPFRWIATSRYGERTAIQVTLDLVSLNYEWWERSRSRLDGGENPTDAWAALLEEYGFIRVHESISRKYYVNL